jgi:hypothetical protein
MGLFPIILIFSMSKKTREILFAACIILAVIAALYHLAGIFYKVNRSPVWRHALFILINIICIYGLLKRPRWFAWFFGALLLQQWYSHGSDIGWHWENEHRIDWISMAVVLLMPAVFILLLTEKGTDEKTLG